MSLFWIVYWIILLISLIFSIYIFIKKNRLMGIIQGILTTSYSIFSFMYVVLNRNYTTGISEINFMVTSLLKGEIGAIFVLLLLLILILVFIYNVFSVIIKNK